VNREELGALQTTAAQGFIADHLQADVQELSLHGQAEGEIPLRACIEQIACRRKALQKLPSLATTPFLYEPLALQQCSSETTARYKGSILKGATAIDLCGGLGIDTLFLSDSFSSVHYCEIDPLLCSLFAANVRTMAKEKAIAIHHIDGIEFLRSAADASLDWLYCDPSRRGNHGREIDLFYCQPPVPRYETLFLAKARAVCIKASPAFDITKALKNFTALSEIQVVSVDGECKELLLFLRSHRETEQIPVSAILLRSDSIAVRKYTHTLPVTPRESDAMKFAAELGPYFLDPDPAIVKAGLVSTISQSLRCTPLASQSPYLTSSQPPIDFPGRVFTLEKILDWKRKNVRNYLTSHGIRKAIVARRDFAIRPEEIRALFELAEGGPEYLFFTRIASRRAVCIHAHRMY
jgi:hypothetical protein